MKIKTVTPMGIRVPMTKPIKLAGVAITDAESLIVRIEDTDGTVGWGEATTAPMMTGETVESMVAAVKFMTPHLEGMKIDDASEFFSRLHPLMYGNGGAKSGVDCAVYDLIAKCEGKPLYELLGGKQRDQSPVLWLLGDAVLESDVQSALEKQDEGFKSFKVKVGGAAAAKDLERSKAVCDALDKSAKVSADANQGFTVESAIEYARGAEDAGLAFFEQPVDGFDIEGMTQVAATTPVPIAADEGIHSIDDIEIHRKTAAASGGCLKAIKLGGLTNVMAASRLCADIGFHLNIAGKLAETSISGAANVHLSLAAPQLDWDMSITSHYLKYDICKTPIGAVDGYLTAGDQPGLGIDVDESKLAKATYLK
jgi:L-alanine-DL-glutamate epimerase-like enolase superfamily enzyme